MKMIDKVINNSIGDVKIQVLDAKDFTIVLKNVVSDDLCKFISREFRLFEKCINVFEQIDITQEIGLTESFSVYSPIFLESLSLHIQPFIEAAVGKELFPTYSYGRIYKTDAVLEPHLDRKSSEYTVSCCLEKDIKHDWQLAVKRKDGYIEKISLDVGDILIYPGRDLNHWRPGKFKGTEQIQAFIQYVDANGTSRDLKWDTRPEMGLPWEFASNDIKQDLTNMMNTIKDKDHEELTKTLPNVIDIINNLNSSS